MSELIQKHDNRATIRWKLLTGASVIALTATLAPAKGVNAEEASRPLLWIELGGQMEHLSGIPQAVSPPFFASASPAVLAPMIEVQKPAPNSFGENAEIEFAPEKSGWIFSAAIRYGRSSTSKHRHYESAHPTVPFTNNGVVFAGQNIVKDELGDGLGRTTEAHLVLDFKAGKDVGLGAFGAGSSVLSAGVRYAQFSSGMHATLLARPTYVSGPFFSNIGKYRFHEKHFQSNTAVIMSKRNTHAVGPTVSWDSSLPVAGSTADAELTIDWGINASLLFGRQRARVHHQTKGYYFNGIATFAKYSHRYTNPPVDRTRSRSVVIPNVGGTLGLSLKFPNAKVSLGYRADMYFNAMDGGIDTRKSENRGFYGPFASISVGLGD